MNTIIRRFYSTKPMKSALTYSNRQKLNATESSILEPRISFNDDTSEFHISMYPYYVRDAIPRQESKELISVVKRFDELCYYCGPERELSPSFVLLNSYKTLELPHKLTSENLKLASLLAWCLEMIATGFIFEDDIMDNTHLRWKKRCYHEQKDIGLTALTDTRKLYMSAYRVLKKYFSTNPSYVQLTNILCKMTLITALGQSLDVDTNSKFRKNRDFGIFSYNRYKAIVKYKTGFILHEAPTLAAIHLAQINSKNFLDNLLHICDRFALYRQAQDDVWDVYGDFNFVGKLGSDIPNGKCTWLIITAMQHANECQLNLLEKHYGQESVDSQMIVRQIYREIDVLNKFGEFKYNLIQDLKNDIQRLPLKSLRTMCYEHVDQYIDIDEHLLDYY